MAEDRETVTLTIDGKEVTVPKGTTVLQAAEKLGISIPHFCYHPELSIAGVCRMCVVEIEKMPKLATSCSTVAGQGMVVRTGHSSEKVAEAVRSILELHFINHPIDCPICDQAGECKLQDYYYEWGLYKSRFREKKVVNAKHTVIGPMVVLDADRCILCSRCVRFCREVPKTEELCIVNRGDHAEIALGTGKTLDNPYSANVVDICPVGAHTLRDFRFQCRAWFLEKTDGVCPGCARGCSITVEHRKGRVYRLKPRTNPAVNGPWLCDQGRLSYKRLYEGERLEAPMVRKAGKLARVGWKEGLAEAAKLVEAAGSGAAFVASPDATNEECHLLAKLAGAARSTALAVGTTWAAEGPEDGLLRRADLSANRTGAVALLGDKTLGDVVAGAEALVVLGGNLMKGAPAEVDEAFHRVSSARVLATHLDETSLEATVCLPIAAFAERAGTVTNFEGWTGLQGAAVPPPGEARPAVRVLADLIEALTGRAVVADPVALFDDLARTSEVWKGVAHKDLAPLGKRAPRPEPAAEASAGQEEAS